MLRPKLIAKGVTSNDTTVWVQFTHRQDRVLMMRSYNIDIRIHHANGKKYMYVYDVDDAQGRIAYNRIKIAKRIGEHLVALEMFGRKEKSGHRGLVPWLQEQTEAKTGLVRRL